MRHIVYLVLLLNHYISEASMNGTLNVTMCREDPSSFTNSHEFLMTHLHLNLTVDFENKVLNGSAQLQLQRLEDKANVLILDTRDLDVKSVQLNKTNEQLEWKILQKQTHSAFGTPMYVKIPSTVKDEDLSITIHYQTSPASTALAWMEPAQTAGKTHPYLFSQCQTIHCRSMVPLQDTPSVKFPYTAAITAPSPLTALMSGLRDSQEETGGATVFRFRQPVAIPAYLIALAVGDLESRKLSERCTVWSEPSVVDAAADEFKDTEKMLATAEEICGPYVWGVYDLLVLPPSFPYGGMENPSVTFVTPSLLAGDRSLVSVVAHEISHSWTGNLVTNRNWEHFWLNEGFTMFLERKILTRTHGEPTRHFSAMEGWRALKNTIKTLGADNPLTCLSPKLAGVDPDDSISQVPYEKGHTFLWYLEELLGGPTRFDPFLRAYVEKFAYKSITTDEFRSFLEHFFAKDVSAGVFEKVDWNTWLHTPGMPPYQPVWDETLANVSSSLAQRWLKWNTNETSPFAANDVEQLSSPQLIAFLDLLLEHPPLSVAKLRKMEELYAMNARRNAEVRFRWLRLCVAARWLEQVPLALQFVTDTGRMKYLLPLYADLGTWDEVRQRTIETYRRNVPNMMHVAVQAVAKALKL